MTARRMLLGAGAGPFNARTYYGLINGQNGDAEYHIGAVTRTGGVWSEYASNPVLSKGSGWESGLVKDPWLMPELHGGLYVMYFSGYNGTSFRIGRATASSHEGPWTKYGSNPVLGFGGAGSFDETNLYMATVLYEPADTGKEWKCWYGANDAAGLATVGYAHSSDGISWTKVGKVLDVGGGGAWDHYGISPNSIMKVGSTYYLTISGRGSSGAPYNWQGGLATFTDPEGTYTKYASNPTLLHRSADANTTQTVTGGATVSTGATTVPVPTPSAFNVGEPCALVDGGGAVDPFIGYITAIGGSTVTLDRPTTATYTGASVFRSFAYNSTIFRSVLAQADGTYLGFGTLFQPVEDLSIPGSKLYEAAFEFTAPALTGPWSYRYVAGRGLLFPLLVGAAWHTKSAENPSVIAAP